MKPHPLSVSFPPMSDADFAKHLLKLASGDNTTIGLADGLFKTRRLYKRFAEYNYAENAELHSALARRPYGELQQCSEQLASELSRKLARPLQPNDVIIDAPPVKLEVQFNLSVICKSSTKQNPSTMNSLAEISPVVKSLATDQFDNFVKKVRVFIAPERAAELTLDPQELTTILLACVH